MDFIIKTNISPRHRWAKPMLVILFKSFSFLALRPLNYVASKSLTLSVPDEGYLETCCVPNTNHLQQVEHYVRGYTWQLKKLKLFYRFHVIVLDRWDCSFECFNSKHYL